MSEIGVKKKTVKIKGRTGWDVAVGTAEDLVLAEPLGVDGSEQAERHHRVLAVEDVVDQALKVEGVVAVRHDVRRVGRRQPERVRELVRLVGKRRHLCPAKKTTTYKQRKTNQPMGR